ncbi:c75c6129-d145-427a-bd58-96c392d8c4d2-CDS [Sclerotinia trifoliorum]|uniref:C75c6129-d145-427a-bd58-96c392d8c4d2-CDS n=1 Tax=Sclerotinia trifoliorum TaxID=28548 RepID=A0A8H2ZP24_9HELO|nr:c75c6129-d145-427a-bd58-96c392d8c4d2-CDS [Sclerotinia trifoliorum]
MFKSKEKAANAALNGEGAREFDTQQCWEWQEAIISSSAEKPATANDFPSPPVASSNFSINATSNDREAAGTVKHEGQAEDAFDDIEAARAQKYPLNREKNPFVPDPASQEHANDGHSSIFPTTRQDDARKLRPFYTNGNLQHTRSKLKAMEGEYFTQKSNLSLTQENPDSLYEALDLQKSREDVQGTNPELSSSPPIPIEREVLSEQQSNGVSGNPISTNTGSTVRTYEENDTGHINFDGFQSTSVPDEGHFESQDPPVAPPTRDLAPEDHLEPKTPAPSVNPFSDKGSVMKQHELFGATQPSSIGRLGGSPTSSRPSPDVYNGFRSSQDVDASPLVRRSEVISGAAQDSMRSLLRSMSTETPVSASSALFSKKAQSFNSAIRKPLLVREPQDTYISMKESQERRRKLNEFEVYSGSESDSDIEALPKKYQKAAREKKRVREEAALIERRPNSSGRLSLSKEVKPISPTSSMYPRSTKPQRESSQVTSSQSPQALGSTPTAVEVPASGRRRSIQEDYVAQCEGFDARDTQPTQQDIIADSQAAPVSSNILASSPVPGSHRTLVLSDVEKNGPKSTSPSQRLPKQMQQPTSQENLQSKNVTSMNGIQCMDFNISALFDQDLTTSPNGLPSSQTFKALVPQMQDLISDGVASTVLETSQATDRLKPMGEIAEISLSIANNDEFDGLPGFNVDEEFNEVIGVSNDHTPKSQPRFQPQIVTTPSPIDVVPTGSAATFSSGLSSAPTTLEPPSPIANNTVAPAARNVSEMELIDHNPPEEEQHTELPTLAPPVQISLGDLEKEPSPLASTEHDDELFQRTPAEEPQLPSTKRRRDSVPQSAPRKSSRISKNHPKKPIHPKPQPRMARTTRLSSVSSTTSNAFLSTTDTGPASASRLNSTSSTSSRPRGDGATKAKDTLEETPLPTTKRGRPRRSTALNEREVTISAPPSKRKSTLPPHEDSEDPLALSAPSPGMDAQSKKSTTRLFNDMAFAVSYVGAEKDKQAACRLIRQHGGRILDDGFEILFTSMIAPSKSHTEDLETREAELEVASSEANVRFVALIADEHSRRTKFMQALALGLPCISGRWISDCVTKGFIIDWLPYLLSAGSSSFLGGAVKSRYLHPYPASEANLNDTFTNRPKLLQGKSILIVTGKGKAGEKRKPYIFLTRALGPTRLGQAQDLAKAKEMLLDAENKNADYDWLYVDGKQDVEAAVFENPPASTAGGSRKRKRTSIKEDDASAPLPKRIRVINDEIIIQSLILGQLIEE